MLSCPRDFFLMFQTFPECSSSTMFVIQKHSGSVRLKGRNITSLHLSEETWPLPSYSQFTSLTVKYCWFRNLLKSFCPCCYLTWLSKPFSHEINELKNTAEALACVKKSACISITQSFMNCWLQQWLDTRSYKHPCTISPFIWFITQLISHQTVGTRLFTLLSWLASC